jgi:hypothetical protein
MLLETIGLVIAAIILGISYALIFYAALILLNIERDMRSGEYKEAQDELDKAIEELNKRIRGEL